MFYYLQTNHPLVPATSLRSKVSSGSQRSLGEAEGPPEQQCQG